MLSSSAAGSAAPTAVARGESDKKGKKDVGATAPIHVVEAADTEGGAPADGTPAGGGSRWVHVPC